MASGHVPLYHYSTSVYHYQGDPFVVQPSNVALPPPPPCPEQLGDSGGAGHGGIPVGHLDDASRNQPTLSEKHRRRRGARGRGGRPRANSASADGGSAGPPDAEPEEEADTQRLTPPAQGIRLHAPSTEPVVRGGRSAAAVQTAVAKLSSGATQTPTKMATAATTAATTQASPAASNRSTQSHASVAKRPPTADTASGALPGECAWSELQQRLAEAKEELAATRADAEATVAAHARLMADLSARAQAGACAAEELGARRVLREWEAEAWDAIAAESKRVLEAWRGGFDII